MLGDGFRALGRRAVVAGEAHRGERMGTQADLVRVSARHQRRPRRRAQGRGVEVVVAKAVGGQRIDVGRVDETAEAAVLGKAHVIQVDDEHVGRAGLGFDSLGIPLHRFLVGPADLAFELLAVLLEGLVVRFLVLRPCRRDAEKRHASQQRQAEVEESWFHVFCPFCAFVWFACSDRLCVRHPRGGHEGLSACGFYCCVLSVVDWFGHFTFSTSPGFQAWSKKGSGGRTGYPGSSLCPARSAPRNFSM